VGFLNHFLATLNCLVLRKGTSNGLQPKWFR